MNRPIRIALCALVLSACGGATAASETENAATNESAVEAQGLSAVELAKLDDVLRDRVRAEDDQIFPVRVKFTRRPSRSDLTELFLVAIDDDAVGRVDRATLKAIAARDDVAHIVYVDAGYAEE